METPTALHKYSMQADTADDALDLIDAFFIQHRFVYFGCSKQPDGWSLDFTIYVRQTIPGGHSETLVYPSEKLRSTLREVGLPVEFGRDSLRCEVPEISVDLLRRIEKAVAGDQREFWKADPAILQDIENDPGVPTLTRIERR